MDSWQLIVLLGCVIIVYALLFSRKQHRSMSSEMLSEMEESLEHFVAEMNEGNETILQQITRMKQDHDQQVAKMLGRIERLEQQTGDLFNHYSQLQLAPIQSAVMEGASTQPEETIERAMNMETKGGQPETIHKRYHELLEWHREGKSVEYIAKNSGMNNGEVQLILQLASQEDKSNV